MNNLHMTFRKMEATDALKKHIDKKCSKFEQYVTYPIEIYVTVSVEKVEHVAEVVLRAEHKQLVAKDKSENLYESINGAVAKLETQLKKEREKHKGHQAAIRVSHDDPAPEIGADGMPHRPKRRQVRTTKKPPREDRE